MDGADLVLFTSVNAIDYAHQQRPLPWPAIATGIGNVSTAWLKELGQLHIQQAVPPFTSEGFVDRLKQGSVKNLVVVKGDGGRSVIQSACAQLGIHCTSLAVYKRVLPQHHSDDISSLLETNPPTVICATSNEVLQNLITLAGDRFKSQLQALPLIVNSERSVALARELGFNATVLVAGPAG